MKTSLTSAFETFFQLKQPHQRIKKSRLDTLRERRAKAEMFLDRYTRANRSYQWSAETNPLKAVQAKCILRGIDDQINRLQQC